MFDLILFLTVGPWSILWDSLGKSGGHSTGNGAGMFGVLIALILIAVQFLLLAVLGLIVWMVILLS